MFRKKVDKEKANKEDYPVVCSWCYHFDLDENRKEMCSSSKNRGYDYYGYHDAFLKKPKEINN